MATPIPTNAARFDLDEVVAATGGELVRGSAASVGVSTDSRTVREGTLFVALTGAKFDAHDFVADVAARGARAVVVSRDVDVPSGVGVVRVADTLGALGDLARAHRRRWARTAHPTGPRAVVAVTGSAGKTTTRRTIAALFEAVGEGMTLESEGNLNNLVGAPMTLFGLEAHHRFAVVEIGTNARGEIARLASIVEPDAGVVTLVAVAHTEGLGTIDEVGVEKGALFRALGPGGVAVGNVDDPRVARELASSPARRKIGYGFAEGAAYRVLEVGRAVPPPPAWRMPGALVRGPDGREERWPMPRLGAPGALAVAGALAVVTEVAGAPPDPSVANVTLAQTWFDEVFSLDQPGRMTPRPTPDHTLLLDDTYNANPASMAASIRTAADLARHERRNLVLVLGEMRELGSLGPGEHDAIGELAVASGASYVVAVGGLASRIADKARAAGVAADFAADSRAAVPLALARVRAGDVVLVKGSRGVATEIVVRALVDRVGGGTA